MTIDKFEDVIAWQKAKDLAVIVYKVFGKNKDYSFRDQIQRAVISISNNIAEGFERKGDKEFKQFLCISKGSCGEARSMLYIAKELGYVDEIKYTQMNELAVEVSRMLGGFIKKL